MLGLVGAHVLDYTLLFRNAVVRSGVLVQTGHGYFGHAFKFALVSAVLAAIGSFALGFARARFGSHDHMSVRRIAVILALIQSGGFIALEAGERIAAHALAQQMLKVTLLGVLLQCLIAGLTALVVTFLERAGETLARALRNAAPPRRVTVVVQRPADVPLPRPASLTRASPRAPPFALTS